GRLLSRDVPALDADRIRREAESDRGNAGVRRGRVAIRDEPIARVRGIPEIPESPLLELRDERVEDSRSLAQPDLRPFEIWPPRTGSSAGDGKHHNDQQHHDWDWRSRHLSTIFPQRSACCD